MNSVSTPAEQIRRGVIVNIERGEEVAMMTGPQLPNAMVLRAAIALHDAECSDRDCTATTIGGVYGDRAAAALAAAVSVCEVDEAWRVHHVAVSGDPDDDLYSSAYTTRERAEQHIAAIRDRRTRRDEPAEHEPAVERFLVITTPPETG